jgi:hypothetical protein
MQFNLTLSFKSGSHSDSMSGIGGERAMSEDWIYNEIKRIREEKGADERKAQRTDLMMKQASGHWDSLKWQVKNEVEKINATPEIQQKLACNLLFQDLNISTFKVIKETYPAVYLTVENHSRYISIERKIVTNGQNRQVKEERENLEFDMDDSDRLFLKTQDGKALHVGEASEYLLRLVLMYSR